MTRAFPDGFIWGSATAAHQVEGGNVNSDFWAMEHAQPSLFVEPSDDATDQYHRFADDMAILSAIGLNAYRFSVEWARIQPEPDVWSEAALDHYQRCVFACLERGITPVVTLQHFTLPRWVARRGGFHDPEFPDLFARYAERAAGRLQGVPIWCTINELNVPLLFTGGLVKGRAKHPDRYAAAEAALGGPIHGCFVFADETRLKTIGVRAHRKAYDAVKAARPEARVGLTLSIAEEVAEPGGEATREARLRRHYLDFMGDLGGDDFIGVQTYTRVTSKADGTAGPREGAPLTTMRYEDWPPAVAACCRWTWAQTGAPVIVTESGLAEPGDLRRGDYVEEVLTHLQAACAQGVPIGGYFYWSLLDNFEWFYGYAQKFGLVAVDRATQRRFIKPSALRLGAIARANALPA